MIHVGGDDEQKEGGGGGGRGGDGGLGEVRKIHIVYFLTRKGRTEQPHLIRVYHRHRNGGVRLRDVKRWLSKMRGKDMVDSYAWSYKRRYRTGYVWQDLTDDELITPLDDNEYILKGSNISCFPELPSVALSISHTTPPFLRTEEKNLQQENGDDEKPDPKSNLSSPHPLPDIPEDLESSSPETRHPPSSLVNASTQTEPEQEEGEQEKNENGSGNVPSLGKSKTCRGGGRGIPTANLFRNLITCGGAETLDSVMMPINLRRRSGVEENGGKGFGYRRIPIHRSSTPPENPRSSFGGKSTKAEGEVGRVTEPCC